MKRCLFFALVLSLFVQSQAVADPVNILVNGSFETGPAIPSGSFTTVGGGSAAITGWTVTGGSIDYIGPSWTVSDGIRAIDLDGNSSIGGIRQTFSTTVGSTYLVSFDLAGNADGAPRIKNVNVTVDSFSQSYSFDTLGKNRSSLGWQKVNFSFVASGSSATLAFASLSPSGNSFGALIDNVSVITGDVSSVPEPSSILSLGTGLALFSIY